MTAGRSGDRYLENCHPRINAEFPLVEGTGEPQLRKGIGHAETSVLPGNRTPR